MKKNERKKEEKKVAIAVHHTYSYIVDLNTNTAVKLVKRLKEPGPTDYVL